MIIGTAGHIDHGKTSLVKALTGVDTDRLKEEKARGITIDLGFAYTPLPNGETLGFIDVPGHEKLIRNMLAGIAGIDFVLLVVAADDGPMPQTREHLAILDLLGMKRGAVALTKIDRVSPQRADAAANEVQALLSGTGLAQSPVFSLSAVSGMGVDALRSHLEQVAMMFPARPAANHFRMAVDRSFALAGAGTVVTGTVYSGMVRVDDRLLVSPSGREVRVRGIHAQDSPSGSGFAGQRCALNLSAAQFGKGDVHRGDWLLEAAIHAPVQRFDARCRLLDSEQKALRHWTPVHLHVGAADVGARIAVLEGEAIAPGGTALVQLITDQPVCVLNGDRFIMRDQSATRTLGGGRVLDPFPPARNRRTHARLSALRALEHTSHREALLALVQSADQVDLNGFALTRNIRQQEAQALYRSLSLQVITASSVSMGFTPARWAELQLAALDRLAIEHQQAPDMIGPDRARLHRMTLPAMPQPAFFALLDELVADGRIAQHGPWLHLPAHKVVLTPAEEKLWQRILPLLQDELFQPPRVRDIAHSLDASENEIRMLLRRVARAGDVYLVAHDHYFTKDAVGQLSRVIRKLAEQHDCVRAAQFRDGVGAGRKLAIQILEFFDRIGYTRRTGDAHRLRQDALML